MIIFENRKGRAWKVISFPFYVMIVAGYLAATILACIYGFLKDFTKLRGEKYDGKL